MDVDGLPLAEALSSLRNELYQAIEQADDEELQFEIGEIQLELQLVVTTKGAVKAGASLWRVVTAEASAERASQRSHRVSFTLNPISTAAPGGVRVGDAVPERPR